MAHTSTRLIAFTLVAALAGTVMAKEPVKPKKKGKPRRPNPVTAKTTDNPKLPRVLLIGDSISMGYTVPVRKLLANKANVHRPPTNCGPTTRGLDQIDAWLGDKPWDVIHFNWGLHDLKYMGPAGQNLADPKSADSHQQVPPAEYEKNLDRLVARMKKTGALLIWCATTPVPEGCAGRVAGDSAKYNKIAAKVMKKHKVVIHDLFTFAKEHEKEIQRPANVHYTPEGSQKLAQRVAEVIEMALKEEAE